MIYRGLRRSRTRSWRGDDPGEVSRGGSRRWLGRLAGESGLSGRSTSYLLPIAENGPAVATRRGSKGPVGVYGVGISNRSHEGKIRGAIGEERALG